MKVQFDLRPALMLEKERKQKSFNLTRILAIILVGAFFFSSIGYIALMFMERVNLQNEVLERQNIVANLGRDNNNLQRQVNDLKAREKVFADTLKIMQDDLPTVEVLNALESEMDNYGIGFNSLKFVIGRVTRGVKAPDIVEVAGTVASDKQIIDFSDRLRGTGVFSDVLLPATNRNERTNMISFTLRMPILPIGEIKTQ